MKTHLALASLLVAVGVLCAAGRASAGLVAHPRGPGLAYQAESQRINLAHALYVCRRGGGANRRWSCSAVRWLQRELGETELAIAELDWLDAVAFADRVFPGSAGWLRSCSTASSEGGWGRWVWNGGSVVEERDRVRARDHRIELARHGSGAGGWLQFLDGTFASNGPRAFAEARARGFRIPRRYLSWYSRVGQAVTGASMLRHGQTGEWSGSGC